MNYFYRNTVVGAAMLAKHIIGEIEMTEEKLDRIIAQNDEILNILLGDYIPPTPVPSYRTVVMLKKAPLRELKLASVILAI